MSIENRLKQALDENDYKTYCKLLQLLRLKANPKLKEIYYEQSICNKR